MPSPTDEQREKAREVVGATDPKPCDCISQEPNGAWMHRCYCVNSGDIERVSVWCDAENMVGPVAKAIADARREGAEAMQRSCEAVARRGHCTSSGCDTQGTEPWHSNLCPVGIGDAIRSLPLPGDKE